MKSARMIRKCWAASHLEHSYQDGDQGRHVVRLPIGCRLLPEERVAVRIVLPVPGSIESTMIQLAVSGAVSFALTSGTR
jgi:hypothetical protein